MKSNCIHCGRDTPNKCQVCTGCLANYHMKEHAEAGMAPTTLYADEEAYDYSENALGPKQADERTAVWSDTDKEWRRVDT